MTFDNFFLYKIFHYNVENSLRIQLQQLTKVYEMNSTMLLFLINKCVLLKI